jgi:arylsulfatase A-like enzyme
LDATGYARQTSPNVDRLAARGALFENAVTQAPETLPAHMSLFTGLYPNEHRVRHHGERLSPDIPSLVEIFRKEGYRTAAFTEGGSIASVFGFDRAFHSYHDAVTRSMRGQKLIEETFALVEKFLQLHSERPFLLFVHTYEIHDPYDPPAEALARFAGFYQGTLRPPLTSTILRKLFPGSDGRPSAADLKFVSDAYDAGIRHADDQLARFLSMIEEQGLKESTYLIIFSDHGEEFLEHFDFARHAHTLYEELIHMPLIITGPGVTPRRIGNQVQLLDVLPTLLEVAGIESVARPTSGRSFAALLQGGSLPERTTFAEDATGFQRSALRARIDGCTYKLIHSPEVERDADARRIRDSVNLTAFNGILQEWELYCLDEDPGERHNLATERPEVLSLMKGNLLALTSRHAGRHLRENKVPLGDADRERLRALGYPVDTR